VAQPQQVGPQGPMGLPAGASSLQDLSATVPMSKNVLGGMRPERPSAPAEGEDPATGTQLLDMSKPVASPNPEWKQEMRQALEAHRQSSMNLEAIVLPPAAGNGETQMLQVEQLPQVQRIPTMDPTTTTSSAGALSQPSGRFPVPPGIGRETLASGGRPKGSRAILWASIAAGVSLLGLVGTALFVLQDSGDTKDGTAEQASTGKAQATAAAPATATATSELPRAPVKAAEAVETAEPVATEKPVEEAPVKQVQNNGVASTQGPAPTAPVPVQTTKKTGAAPVTKSTGTTTTATTTTAPKKNCSGVGFFKKCK